jgi:hypothetical protein
MKFRTLQDNLRDIVRERIDSGELTGLRLAEQAGFKQAHISNFLNHKRGLSLEAMDKVLSVQRLSVLDLIDSAEINKRASSFRPSADDFDNVAVTDSNIAASEPAILRMHVQEMSKFKKAFLKRLKAQPESGRAAWQRFVIIKADAKQGLRMYPRTSPGAILLLDRHYTSLTPYRKTEPNIYAVRQNGGCAITYVETLGNQLILRPHNTSYPIEVITLHDHQKPSDVIVGRVAYVGTET